MVIESGSYNEFMKLKGKYYKAFNIQVNGINKNNPVKSGVVFI